MKQGANSKHASKTIFVRWVRSGIGFSKHQKEMVRSLGLRRLNQVVELKDTPPVRGLVARIPHLVEMVGAPSALPLDPATEVSIRPPEAAAARTEQAATESPAAPAAGENAQE